MVETLDTYYLLVYHLGPDVTVTQRSVGVIRLLANTMNSHSCMLQSGSVSVVVSWHCVRFKRYWLIKELAAESHQTSGNVLGNCTAENIRVLKKNVVGHQGCMSLRSK